MGGKAHFGDRSVDALITIAYADEIGKIMALYIMKYIGTIGQILRIFT